MFHTVHIYTRVIYPYAITHTLNIYAKYNTVACYIPIVYIYVIL
ncbi:hypothetical protein CoNPh12_CDS0184 [Staphylococcus phage S-CoN_Ph12]|nr:hypothetical protein CoNPh12_CDS0184 [Staphylococcus phage S-CoN_Ph12]